MLAYPETQSSCTVRAHAELDAVVGRACLPTYADYPHPPNIRTLLKAGPSLEKSQSIERATLNKRG